MSPCIYDSAPHAVLSIKQSKISKRRRRDRLSFSLAHKGIHPIGANSTNYKNKAWTFDTIVIPKAKIDGTEKSPQAKSTSREQF